MHISHSKGGLFSYVGELRIRVNGVPQVDYTGWTVTGRLEDKDGNEISVLTVEWVDITTGALRVRIPAADTLDLAMGFNYKLYIVVSTPAAEPLQPLIITVAFKDT